MSRRRVRRRRKAPSAKKDFGSSLPKTSAWLIRLGAAVFLLLLLLLAGVVAILWPVESRESAAVVAGDDEPEPELGSEVRNGIKAAEEVAKSFLGESDPYERLRWVRDADGVAARLGGYSREAGEALGEIERMIGHVREGGRGVTAFAVAMPSGEARLLEVVETEKGPKVDWDAYARYGTASWGKLIQGKVDRAVVRVFCEPSSERPAPFGNQGKWTAFRLSSPDLPQAVLGFARVGGVREAMMKKVVLGTPGYRQRFTLEVLHHEGEDEPLFEITRCLAVGWIVDERDVEDEWEDR